MSDVMLLGEPMGLFTATEIGSLKEATNFHKSIAGAEINVGIGLSRLGQKVQYVSKLGKDPIGEFIFEGLKKENLGTDWITFDEQYTTGLMLKNKVEKGDPDTAYYRNFSAFSTLSLEDVKQVDFTKVRLLHVTGIPPAISKSVREVTFYLMKKAKEAGTFITFDPNLRPALWQSQTDMIQVLNELASYANVVLPGVTEGEKLVGSSDLEEIAAFYLEQGSDVVIIKDGAKGALVSEKGKESLQVPGCKVEKVVDTVGAGDGFAVGVLSGYLEGLSWKEATKRANAIGALQVQHSGDNEGLPTKEELERYLSEKL